MDGQLHKREHFTLIKEVCRFQLFSVQIILLTLVEGHISYRL